MQRNNYVYIEHIKFCIDKINSFTKGVTEEEFLKDELIQDAVIRNFEVIGEAVKQLSDDFRKKYNHIPWKDIAGMRDVLIHDYLGVDLWAVWSTVVKYLPDLEKEILILLENKA